MRSIERLNSPWLVVAVLMVILLVDGFLLYRYQRSLGAAPDQPITSMEFTSVEQFTTSTEQETIEVDEASVPEETTVGETAPTSTAAVEDGVRVGVSVVGAPSWLQIQADGQTVLEQVSQPGFSQEFEASQEISIRTGNAGAVQVERNGLDLGRMGESGEVATRTYQ